jgi:hypothetical protein
MYGFLTRGGLPPGYICPGRIANGNARTLSWDFFVTSGVLRIVRTS